MYRKETNWMMIDIYMVKLALHWLKYFFLLLKEELKYVVMKGNETIYKRFFSEYIPTINGCSMCVCLWFFFKWWICERDY